MSNRAWPHLRLRRFPQSLTSRIHRAGKDIDMFNSIHPQTILVQSLTPPKPYTLNPKPPNPEAWAWQGQSFLSKEAPLPIIIILIIIRIPIISLRV